MRTLYLLRRLGQITSGHAISSVRGECEVECGSPLGVAARGELALTLAEERLGICSPSPTVRGQGIDPPLPLGRCRIFTR